MQPQQQDPNLQPQQPQTPPQTPQQPQPAPPTQVAPGQSFQPPVDGAQTQPTYQPQPVPQNFSQQQPVQFTPQPPASKQGLQKKIILGAVAVVVAATIIGLLVLFLTGGKKLSTGVFQSDSVSFTVQLPEGWSAQADSLQSLEQVLSNPTNAENSADQTSISVTRILDSEYAQPSDFAVFANEQSSITQQLQGIENFSLDTLGTKETPSFLTSYRAADSESGLEYKMVDFYGYESDSSYVQVNFVISNNYQDLENTTADIINSYQVR